MSQRSAKNSTGVKPGDNTIFNINNATPFIGRVEKVDAFATATAVVDMLPNEDQDPLALKQFIPLNRRVIGIEPGHRRVLFDSATTLAVGDKVAYRQINGASQLGIGGANAALSENDYLVVDVHTTTGGDPAGTTRAVKLGLVPDGVAGAAQALVNLSGGAAIPTPPFGQLISYPSPGVNDLQPAVSVSLALFVSAIDPTDSNLSPALDDGFTNKAPGGGLAPTTAQLDRYFTKVIDDQNQTVFYQKGTATMPGPQKLQMGSVLTNTFMVVVVTADVPIDVAMKIRVESFLFNDSIDSLTIGSAQDVDQPAFENVLLNRVGTTLFTDFPVGVSNHLVDPLALTAGSESGTVLNASHYTSGSFMIRWEKSSGNESIELQYSFDNKLFLASDTLSAQASDVITLPAVGATPAKSFYVVNGNFNSGQVQLMPRYVRLRNPNTGGGSDITGLVCQFQLSA